MHGGPFLSFSSPPLLTPPENTQRHSKVNSVCVILPNSEFIVSRAAMISPLTDWVIVRSYFDKWVVVFKDKKAKIIWFELLWCDYFFSLQPCNLNMFVVWTLYFAYDHDPEVWLGDDSPCPPSVVLRPGQGLCHNRDISDLTGRGSFP